MDKQNLAYLKQFDGALNENPYPLEQMAKIINIFILYILYTLHYIYCLCKLSVKLSV